MNLIMQKCKFPDEYSILVFDFLACVVQETNISEMSKAQGNIILQHVLSEMAEDQYNFVRGSSQASKRGARC